MRKRLLLIGLLVVGVALLSGCELIDQLIDQITGGGTDGGTGGVVNFPDPGLESAIRNAIGGPWYEEDILDTDLLELTFLNANQRSIVNLEGIQHCTNLTELLLDQNEIVDISPLAGLTNLTKLQLHVNQIVDISPLAGLTNLTELWLWNNEIVDISPLVSLTNLTHLDLNTNQILDINVLSGLTNLAFLSLSYNKIVDISPLVRNAGIGNGDEVKISNNYLCYAPMHTPYSPDRLDVEALISRGVYVYHPDQASYTYPICVEPES